MPPKVMILAAGRGERMKPLTDNCPKPLLEVAGRPLIEYHLIKLAQAGIKQVVINHAYLGEQIESALGDGSRFDLSIRYSREGQALETAGGIIHALDALGDQPFWVINGDIWTDWNYAELLQCSLDQKQLGHLVLIENPSHHPFGDFDLVKGRVYNQPQWTFSGAALYDPALFCQRPPGRLALRSVFVEAIAKQQLTGHVQPGYWCDVGTPQRLALLEQRLS